MPSVIPAPREQEERAGAVPAARRAVFEHRPLLPPRGTRGPGLRGCGSWARTGLGGGAGQWRGHSGSACLCYHRLCGRGLPPVR